ncbi:hypothetical protein [Nocardiopsis sp. YSL2]|uniref:hypothetical protein n=1 Tax=Nocardiopsis sp. YSL2 TaxID=2939492 RepID=UPI0026F41916|nr:hypothetical protein [Nocardiopsis sp. YSL2]
MKVVGATVSPVGMNPTDAYAGGDASLEAASRLRDLPQDWADAITNVSFAMRNPPGVTGWASFGSVQEEHMEDVKSHAVTLAENIQSAASEGDRTDSDASADYRATSSSPILSRSINDF